MISRNHSPKRIIDNGFLAVRNVEPRGADTKLHNPNGIIGARSASPLAPDSATNASTAPLLCHRNAITIPSSNIFVLDNCFPYHYHIMMNVHIHNAHIWKASVL